MIGLSVIGSVLRLPTISRRLVVVGFILLSLPLGALAIIVTPPGTGSAAWWPAAAVAVLAVASSRGTRVTATLLLAAVGALSNYVAGRPLWVSIAFGLANAVEAWVVCALASDRRGNFSLNNQTDALRLMIAVVVGATTIGLLAGATVAATGGEFGPAVLAIAASHASAVLIFVPLFLIPLSGFAITEPRELVLQSLIFGAVVAFVFWPGQALPLSFLPFPFLAWAAFRFRSGIVFIQTLVVTIASTLLTLSGGGPFANILSANPVAAIHVLQAFTIVLASTALMMSEGRNERERLISGIAAREAVLHSGILASSGGILVLEGHPSGVLRRAVFNQSAGLLFPVENWKVGEAFLPYDIPVQIARPFGDIVAGREQTWSGSVETDDDRTLQVRISRADDETSSFVITIEVEDVTARRLAAVADANILKNEKAAVDRLTDLNRQKDDFVSSVSHELRTPVTSIIGYSEELASLDLGDEAQAYVGTIARNAKRLQTLIEDLLDVAMAASVESRVQPEYVDVDELLIHVGEDLAARANARGLTLSIAPASAGGELKTVRGELERVLSNLVSNAVKFTPAGGSVTVSAKRDDALLHIRVLDTGVGIPPEDLDNVFTRFFRSKTAEVVPGTGLGLPITKALVEGLGGHIHLFSDGSSGTEVLVSLPLEWPRFEL